jgi:hypothetical protein
MFQNSCQKNDASTPVTNHRRKFLVGIPNPIFIFKTKEASIETAPAGGAAACKQDNQRAPPTGRSNQTVDVVLKTRFKITVVGKLDRVIRNTVTRTRHHLCARDHYTLHV